MNDGFVMFPRALAGHPALAMGETFSKFEAFFWLFSNAAWGNHLVDRQGCTIKLERGQLCHSSRFLADAW